MPRTRDYAAEYRARVARGQARGKTKAEARGHGKKTAAKRVAPLAPAPSAPTPPAPALPAGAPTSTLQRARDYAREYAARVARVVKEGVSRRVARGHPGRGEVGRAEARQLRRALDIWSPGGWHIDAAGTLMRGPPQPASPRRRSAADRIAEVAGVESPTRLSADERRIRIGDARRFVDACVALGIATEQGAYTLWFSP